MKTVYDDVREERQRQDSQWGGPEHDDRHIPADWLSFIQRKWRAAENEAFGMAFGHTDDWRKQATADYRRRLIQIAALAVAAVESLDRKQAIREREAA
jgi:hypothetical protein